MNKSWSDTTWIINKIETEVANIEIKINTLKGGLNSVYIKDINFCNIKADIDNDMCVASCPVKIKQIYNEDQYSRPVT